LFRLERLIGNRLNNAPLYLDQYYLSNNQLKHQSLTDVSSNNIISGKCIGMVGSILVVEQDDWQYIMPLGKFTGYRLNLGYNEEPNSTTAHQISLF
jgi:hypothetical protein